MRPTRLSARAVLLRTGLFAFLWFVLAGGTMRGWYLALPIVGLATWVSLRTLPSGRWSIRPGGLLRFVPFFLGYSLRGGIDVAARALGFRPRLDPTILPFRLRIFHPSARVFLATVLGLFPGTLTTRVEGTVLHVHVLDPALPVERQVRLLELRVADLFGIPLDANDPGLTADDPGT